MVVYFDFDFFFVYFQVEMVIWNDFIYFNINNGVY